MAIAMRHEPKWLPETGDQRWSYSNTNYVLAGMIIEKVTGNQRSQEVITTLWAPNENAVPIEKLVNDAMDQLMCDRDGS